MREYPELEKLKAFQKAHVVKIRLLGERDDLLLVKFESNKGSWDIYIEDSKGDFEESNQLLCLYLTLKSLEDYVGEPDFLTWADFYGLDDFDPFWLDYYLSLEKICYEIEFHMGKINPFIDSLDYELRSGAFQELIKNKGF